MDAISNPYTPNAGASPEVIVGRDDQIGAFPVLLGRLERGRTEQSMIITGLRGVGKTVLLARFGDLAREAQLPITFVGAGLPQIAELAGDAKSYAERLFKFPRIGSLTGQDARNALTEPAKAEDVEFASDAVDLAMDITQGYPYFIQELGYQIWSIAKENRVTRVDVEMAREAYETKLDSSFFRVRLDRATPLQTAYMRAMSELGPEPQKAADVARVMGRESTQLAPTRAELIDMGLLFTPEHGYAAFTMPEFDKFMLRVVPELVVPPVRRRTNKA